MAHFFDPDVEIKVEAGFGDNPLSTGRTWTDITADVRGVRTKRGRSQFASRVRTGKAFVTLDNSSSAYDPTATGAYSTDIRPMVPIRISATYTSTDVMNLDSAGQGLGNRLQVGEVPLFTGFADAWAQTYTDGNRPEVALSVVDGMKTWNLLDGDGNQYGPTDVRHCIAEVLEDRTWPKAWIDGYTAGTPAQAFTAQGSILRSLRQLEDTDNGVLFIQPDGEAMYQHRGYRAGLSSVATFGDTSTELPYRLNYTPVIDDHNIWNKVRVTPRGRNTQTVSNTDSIDMYVERELVYSDTLHATDAGAAALATALVTRYKDPHLRVDSIRVNPRKQPTTLWPAVLSFDLSTKITVKRRPAFGSTQTLDSYIEGIEHRVSVGKRWETRYRLSQYA